MTKKTNTKQKSELDCKDYVVSVIGPPEADWNFFAPILRSGGACILEFPHKFYKNYLKNTNYLLALR